MLQISERSLYRLALLALVAVGVVVFMARAGNQSLQAFDSAVHARLALHVTEAGALPKLPIANLRVSGDPATFNDHPFTLFWINGWVMRLFGPDAWSARFLPSLLALGGTLAVAWLGALFYGPFAGLGAGLILATTPEFISYGARFQLDPAMIFFILLSFIAWVRGRPVVAGVMAGLGVWMKSPIALLLYPSLLCAAALSRPIDLRKFFRDFGMSLIVSIAVSALIWVITAWLGGTALAWDYWQRQVFGTVVGGRRGMQALDPYLFFKTLGKRYWPWLPLLGYSLYKIVQDRRWRKTEVALSLSAVAIIAVFISSMRFKFPHYYDPVYPFLALLCIDPVADWIKEHRLALSLGLLTLALVASSALLALPIETGPEMFPALRRFAPIIQSYGSCADRALFIDGEQPYGGPGDATAELAFYTDREIHRANCDEARLLIPRLKPEWILVSGKNLQDCVPPEALGFYPSRFLFGNQFLLNRIIPKNEAIDLTPLARELKAPPSCRAPAPLRSDRYFRLGT